MSSENESPALKLLEDQRKARSIVAERFRINNRELIDAHHMIFCALTSMVQRHAGLKLESLSRNDEGRISLIAQFIVGIDHCETSITEGLYAQAAALLKQQLETVSAVEEYRDDRRKDGKTPAIGRGFTKTYGPVYGKFNEISHASQHGWAKTIVVQKIDKLTGASILPVYNGDLARFLFSQHLSFMEMIAKLADELFQDLYKSGLNPQEREWLTTSRIIHVASGLIELGPEAGSNVVADATKWVANYRKKTPGR